MGSDDFIKNSLYVIIMGLLVFVLLFITGCSRPACELQVRTEYVNIPVPCNVELPQKPMFVDDVVKNTVNMMTYTDELEMALFCCTKDPRCVAK